MDPPAGTNSRCTRSAGTPDTSPAACECGRNAGCQNRDRRYSEGRRNHRSLRAAPKYDGRRTSVGLDPAERYRAPASRRPAVPIPAVAATPGPAAACAPVAAAAELAGQAAPVAADAGAVRRVAAVVAVA